jgi:hypothetical protein
MNILRHVAQKAITINTHACLLMLTVYGKVSVPFFKKCGFSDVLARELVVGTTDACKITVKEQHELLARWLDGKITFEEFEKGYEERQLAHLQRTAAVFDRVLCPSA